jgi:hypothetical protein
MKWTCPACGQTFCGLPPDYDPAKCPICLSSKREAEDRAKAHARMYPKKGEHLNLRVIQGGKAKRSR